jgi:phospholipase/carboxylesterase
MNAPMPDSSPIALWRRPEKRGAQTPLVVLLHGLGADETDLIDLARALPPSFAYVSFRAPYAHPEGGFHWFEDRGLGRPIAASVRSSVALVRACLDGPQAAPYRRDRTFVLGFSAGMMMAAALVLDEPSRFAGAVLLSGAIAFDAGIDAAKGRLLGVPVFYAHGTADTVVPAELVTRTARYLRDGSGALLTEYAYAHGHAITTRETADIRAWLDGLA